MSINNKERTFTFENYSRNIWNVLRFYRQQKFKKQVKIFFLVINFLTVRLAANASCKLFPINSNTPIIDTLSLFSKS
ncbi:hypothetical protein X975_14650, partial [Stegodyphus mimosarum]